MAGEGVLIVDDNPMNLQLSSILLAGEGYDVRTAQDAEQAEFILEEFHPRLILLDIQLPGTDGLTLARRLRNDRTHRDVIILAVTAYAMQDDAQKAREAGCNGYLTKPIDTQTFPAIVRSFLNRQPDVDPATAGGDASDLLSGLRNEFLVEGAYQSSKLASANGHRWQRDEAERRLHRWAGLAGTLGFPEIGRKAREIENLMQQSVPEIALEPHFQELAQQFSTALRSKSEDPQVPPEMLHILAGSKVGVCGFDTWGAARVLRAMDMAQGSARVLNEAQSRSPEILQGLDLLLVNIREAADLTHWIESPALAGSSAPILLVGQSKQFLHQPLALWRHTHDLVTTPWDAEEIVLRAYGVLHQTKPATEPRPATSGAKIRVVIADDDPMMGKLISTTLERFGVECHVALDGGEALNLTRRLQPDAVVLDVKMPVLDGFDVLALMRRDARISQVPVLMLTASDEATDVARGFGFGADDYVLKPFNPVELAARVTRLFTRH